MALAFCSVAIPFLVYLSISSEIAFWVTLYPYFSALRAYEWFFPLIYYIFFFSDFAFELLPYLLIIWNKPFIACLVSPCAKSYPSEDSESVNKFPSDLDWLLFYSIGPPLKDKFLSLPETSYGVGKHTLSLASLRICAISRYSLLSRSMLGISQNLAAAIITP